MTAVNEGRPRVMEVLNDIARGNLDDDLDRIAREVYDRRKIVAGMRARATVRALRVGDKVRLVRNIKPRYLVGLTGTVKGKLQTKIDIVIDEGQDTGRFGRTLRTPASCVEKIEDEDD